MIEKRFLLLLNLTPTHTSAVLLDKKWQVKYEHSVAIKGVKNTFSMVEYDPLDIIYSVQSAINTVVIKSKIKSSAIHSISITSSGYASLFWNRQSGTPLSAAFGWGNNMRRRQERLAHSAIAKELKQRSGLSAEYPASAYIFEWAQTEFAFLNTPRAKKDLCFGGVESWVIYNLTGRSAFVTDYTHASKTMFFSVEDKKWDPLLLSEFSCIPEILPKIRPSFSKFGFTNAFVGLSDGIPIYAVSEASASRLSGMGHMDYGDCHLFLGEKEWQVKLNIGQEICASDKTWQQQSMMTNDPNHYWVNYMMPLLPMPKALINAGLVKQVLDQDSWPSYPNSRVYFTPQKPSSMTDFVGLTSTIIGIGEDTAPTDIARAYLESMGFLLFGKCREVESELGISLRSLTLSGPLSDSVVLTQFLSDLFQVTTQKLSHNHAEMVGLIRANPLLKGFGVKVTKRSLGQIQSRVPNLDPISLYTMINEWKMMMG